MANEEPQIGGREPLPVEVKEGESYWWCTCGRSKNQPFCDGSHNADDCAFEPQEWVAPASRTVFFCSCKRTKRGPLCDGSHNLL